MGGVFTKLIERNTTIPTQEERGLLHRRRQPEPGRDPRPAGRARDGRLQPHAGQVQPGRHPAGAARRAADRGHLRHRRQRHRERHREGPRHGQGAVHRDPAPPAASRTTRSARWCATPSRTPRTTGGCAGWPTPATQAEARVHEAERQLKDNGDKVDEALRRDLEGAIAAAKDAVRRRGRRGASRPAAESLTEACTGCPSRSTSGPRPPAGTAPRAPRARRARSRSRTPSTRSSTRTRRTGRRPVRSSRPNDDNRRRRGARRAMATMVRWDPVP